MWPADGDAIDRQDVGHTWSIGSISARVAVPRRCLGIGVVVAEAGNSATRPNRLHRFDRDHSSVALSSVVPEGLVVGP